MIAEKLKASYSLEKSLLWLVFIVSVAIYLHSAIKMFDGSLPTWSDEYFYVQAGHNFYLNNTVRAPFTIDGVGAPVLGADTHGIAYPVLHGLVHKIFGYRPGNLVGLNVCLLFAAIGLILVGLKLPLAQKLLVANGVLLSFPVLLLTFTYMQENLHLLFTVGVSFMLVRLYLRPSTKWHLLAFYLLLLFATLFRPTWAFWSVAIVPLGLRHSRGRACWYALISLIYIAYSLLQTRLFSAPYPSFLTETVNMLADGDVKAAFRAIAKHTGNNIKSLFTYADSPRVSYFAYKIIIVALPVVAYFHRKQLQSLYLPFMLLWGVNMLLQLVLNDCFGWREIRFLLPLLVLFLILFAHAENSRAWLYGYLGLCVCMFFAGTYSTMQKWMQEKSALYAQCAGLPEVEHDYQSLAEAFPQTDAPIVVLNKVSTKDNDIVPSLLPLQTANGQRISYVFPYFPDLVKPENYQYILALPDDTDDTLSPVMRSKSFILYRKQ